MFVNIQGLIGLCVQVRRRDSTNKDSRDRLDQSEGGKIIIIIIIGVVVVVMFITPL